MGIIVSKDNDKQSELNARITADLRERAIRNSAGANDSDLVEDSDYVRDLQQTNRFAWLWIMLVIFAVFGLVAIIL